MHIATKCCLYKCNRRCRIYVPVLALEQRMPAYKHFHKQIPPAATIYTWLTFITYPYTLAIVYSSRNWYWNLLAFAYIPCTTAVCTFTLDNFTCSPAVRTWLYIPYHTKQWLLCKYYLAFAAALWTCFRRCARFCPSSMTVRTFLF